jgi:hypothetical protein
MADLRRAYFPTAFFNKKARQLLPRLKFTVGFGLTS